LNRGFILSPGLIKGAPYGARYGYWIREEYHYKGRTLVQMRKLQATSYKRQAASSKQSSSSDQATSGKRQAASSKPQAASSRAAAPS